MSSAEKIAKNVGFLFSTQVADKIISFFLVIIITRYLGDAGFGKYSFAFAFVGIIGILVHFGTSTYVLREVSKYKEKARKLISNAIGLRAFAQVIVFSIALLLARYWPKANEVLLAIFLVMVYSFFDLFNSSAKILFTAYEKNQFGLYATTIEKIITLLLSYLVLSMGYRLNALLFVFIVSSSLTTIYSYVIAKKRFMKISFSADMKTWKLLIKSSLPFWFTLLFQKIYYKTDTLMLTAMKNYEVTGWYNAASTLVLALTFIPTVIINAIFPAMSRFHHQNSKDLLKMLFRKSAYYLTIISIPIAIGISLLAPRLILFIYKKEFIESSVILMILSWSFVFICLNEIMGYLLNSINKQHFFTISNGICAFSNVILNILLIPSLSYVGAAFATVSTQIINFAALYYFTSKNGYSLNLFKISYKPIIAGIIMGIIIASLP
jgi:O-antigen/teichoic acid export membrane protein